MCPAIEEKQCRGEKPCKYSQWITGVDKIPHQFMCSQSRCMGCQCSNYGFFREKLSKTVRNAQSGDRASTEKLIEYYKNYVFQMEKRYFIPGGDREDLFQEGFIGLYQAIKNYRHDSPLSFEDYVSLSVRNSVIRAVRSATQKKQMVLTNARSIFEKSVMSIRTRQFCPEEITFCTFAAERVKNIVRSNLSRRESQILTLKVNGFTAEEIAKQINTDKKTVDNALYRARNKIRHHMIRKTRQKPGNTDFIRCQSGQNSARLLAV